MGNRQSQDPLYLPRLCRDWENFCNQNDDKIFEELKKIAPQYKKMKDFKKACLKVREAANRDCKDYRAEFHHPSKYRRQRTTSIDNPMKPGAKLPLLLTNTWEHRMKSIKQVTPEERQQLLSKKASNELQKRSAEVEFWRKQFENDTRRLEMCIQKNSLGGEESETRHRFLDLQEQMNLKYRRIPAKTAVPIVILDDWLDLLNEFELFRLRNQHFAATKKQINTKIQLPEYWKDVLECGGPTAVKGERPRRLPTSPTKEDITWLTEAWKRSQK